MSCNVIYCLVLFFTYCSTVHKANFVIVSTTCLPFSMKFSHRASACAAASHNTQHTHTQHITLLITNSIVITQTNLTLEPKHQRNRRFLHRNLSIKTNRRIRSIASPLIYSFNTIVHCQQNIIVVFIVFGTKNQSRTALRW